MMTVAAVIRIKTILNFFISKLSLRIILTKFADVTNCYIDIVTQCYNVVKYFSQKKSKKIEKSNLLEWRGVFGGLEGLKGLALVRKSRGYNQLKVAMDLNISRESLSYYENGKRSPDIDMLRRLSAYFNVSIDYLVNGHEFGEPDS